MSSQTHLHYDSHVRSCNVHFVNKNGGRLSRMLNSRPVTNQSKSNSKLGGRFRYCDSGQEE